MEAKDTVLKMRWMDRKVQQDQDALLRKQAEISFKAGIEEVVNELSIIFITTSSAKKQAECVYAKLKEWGID